MARPPKRPLRGDAGAAAAARAGGHGRGRPSPSCAGARPATRGADEDDHPPLDDGEDLAPHPDEELEIEDDDDVRDDAAGLFGIDLGDGNQPQPIDLDGDDDGVEPSTDTYCTSTTSTSSKKSLLSGRTSLRLRRTIFELLLSVIIAIQGRLLDLLLVLAI
jgi:hypothetical protein